VGKLEIYAEYGIEYPRAKERINALLKGKKTAAELAAVQGSEWEVSHSLQGLQCGVHSNRTRETAGSRVAYPVVRKAERFPRTSHNPSHAIKNSQVNEL
jgi:hypothetical protein